MNVTYDFYTGHDCPLSCETTINYVTFNDSNPLLPWKVNACRSDLRITSLYLCFDEFCQRDGAVASWIETQSLWCSHNTNVTLPSLQHVLDQWSPEAKNKVERLSATNALEFPSLNHLVIPEHDLFKRAYTTVETANWEYKIHLVYGWYMYYFWIIVVLIGVANRLLLFVYKRRSTETPYLRLPRIQENPNRNMRTASAFILSWLRRNLIIPAAFGNRCARPYGLCTIPPRIQSLTIFLFVIFNIAACSCSYRLTEGNLYWPEKSAQLLRFVSDRTGIISLANFPLLWLFGMRNDVLIWITGWGFGTYNAFHRWVARVATIQAISHSVGYTVMILASGGWPSFSQYWKEHYFWNGEIATIAMCTLVVFSVYTIRRQHYDFFLATHIALSVAVLWTMYYHVEIFTAGEWNIFIWPCAAFWILDRALRLARIFAFNRRPLDTNAKATYDACSNLVRLDVDGSKSLLAPRPGLYYYVHVLDDIRYAHQSHPFTLAFVSPDATSSAITSLAPLSPSPENTEDPPDSSTESDTLLSNNVPKASSNLVFLIRPYNGFTSRLRSSCLLHPRKIRVLVDGPYGHVAPLRTFANVLFLVGGTGVAIPLSHLSGLFTGSSQVLHVKIVWAVRERAFLTTLLRDFHSVLGNKRIDMEVHITKDVGHDDEIFDKDLKNVKIATQRPNVYQVVKEAAENARRVSLAVVCCGPALMADQARKASVQMLGMGHTGIEYFEESFKW
ncbi:hypothetical protein COCSADRAFT_143289 [Bipolaris sorokiniana ND90Pr]|uniref:FAD-binding FR-type domain-containing protein n=1 Tax=Cochliobolus sativus (strain ND90Pr / ATCC 201652) TaxID=665912 RepID=M2R8V3_COCSN|nr:uncharacterized protein COCSADRAFT_143289 [Bipolaris sorokiniana ND90Pr]EMD63374.1 hypothetical protein COCSADRAFT_143289 [Bipolaris sorokiniana ND90Pr]